MLTDKVVSHPQCFELHQSGQDSQLCVSRGGVGWCGTDQVVEVDAERKPLVLAHRPELRHTARVLHVAGDVSSQEEGEAWEEDEACEEEEDDDEEEEENEKGQGQDMETEQEKKVDERGTTRSSGRSMSRTCTACSSQLASSNFIYAGSVPAAM